MNERDFPHIVELSAKNVAGGNLDRVFAFHSERAIESRRGRGQRRDDRDFVRWCFADAMVAPDFCDRFGGVIVTGARARR
jgi:hypothetical protein